jgi:hypothetical protein
LCERTFFAIYSTKCGHLLYRSRDEQPAEWVSRAERKALPRAITAGGPQHFALMVEDLDSLETATTVSG